MSTPSPIPLGKPIEINSLEELRKLHYVSKCDGMELTLEKLGERLTDCHMDKYDDIMRATNALYHIGVILSENGMYAETNVTEDQLKGLCDAVQPLAFSIDRRMSHMYNMLTQLDEFLGYVKGNEVSE